MGSHTREHLIEGLSKGRIRRRILLLITGLLFVSVVSAIAVLARINRNATIDSLRDQQSELVRFAVANVELGVSTGRINDVQNFLRDISSNPLFAGAVVYDADADAILAVPAEFAVPAVLEEQVFETGNVVSNNFSYQAGPITDEDDEVLGYFLLAISFDSIRSQGRRAVLLTTLIGLLILLPVTLMIAWLLAWMEKQLREVNREIEAMLNHLDQGLLTFNLDGSINPQHSLRARKLFGISDFQHATFNDIFGTDEKTVAVFRQWIQMMTEPRFFRDWAKYERLNPIREVTGRPNGEQRVLTIDYRPIIEGDTLHRIMVLATDITGQRKSEEALERARHEQQSDLARILALVRNDRAAMDGFLQNAGAFVEQLDGVETPEALAADITPIFRDLHTLKGNAGSFGFGELARAADDLEDLLIPVRDDEGVVDLDKWAAHLAEMRDELAQIESFRAMLFSGGPDRMSIGRNGYQKLLGDIRRGALAEPERIIERLYELDALPFGIFCEKYQRIIEMQGQQNPDRIAHLKIGTPDAPIHHDLMRTFDGCIVHLIRNAVDHGVEGEEERQDHGKGPATITIAFERSETEARIVVSDDGRGIDPELIGRLALERDLITQEELRTCSQDEKIRLVLRSGFSTKTAESDLSGRGVGLDAVRAYMEDLGGTITLDSYTGRGLTVTLALPRDAGTDHPVSKVE